MCEPAENTLSKHPALDYCALPSWLHGDFSSFARYAFGFVVRCLTHHTYCPIRYTALACWNQCPQSADTFLCMHRCSHCCSFLSPTNDSSTKPFTFAWLA